MNGDKFENYTLDLISLIRKEAVKAKQSKDSSAPEEIDYNLGYLMAYHDVIALMKHEAVAFDIDEDTLGLSGIDPDLHLL